MAHENLSGLCSVCTKEPDCIPLENAAHPILKCEEFKSDYPGLCVSCDRLPTCMYPKHEGGVWMCEECE